MLVDFSHIRDGDAVQPGEAIFLYGLVRAIRPKVCVETGTHKGYAALHIANALEDNGEGHLYTVDPVDWGQVATIEAQSKGIQQHITYQRIRGDELKVDAPIDFAFIDGYHGKQDVIEEIDNLFPQLAEHAVVVFHDCLETEENWHQGVLQALEEKGLNTIAIPSLNWMRIYEHRPENQRGMRDEPKKRRTVSADSARKADL